MIMIYWTLPIVFCTASLSCIMYVQNTNTIKNLIKELVCNSQALNYNKWIYQGCS